MSSAPIVIRCECQGLFQLPQAGMTRAMCPHCKREVAILANGTARGATQPREYQLAPMPLALTPNWNPLPSHAPTLPQRQPNWNPPQPPQQKSYLKVILISLAIGVVTVVCCVALCAGYVYYEIRKEVNNLIARQFTPEPDAAPLAEMQVKPLVSFAVLDLENRYAAQSNRQWLFLPHLW